ncbi:MAG: hypothetical protein JXB38_15790 [Anaerolineales bacterium]|nr:hypothetical protein [Anaerolineales bacterium]
MNVPARSGKPTKHEFVPHIPLILLVVVGIVVGILWGNDYGQSIDEYSNYAHADEIKGFYTSWYDKDASGSFGPHQNRRYYGAAYLIAANFVTEAIAPLVPAWGEYDLWHMLNFFVYIGGVVFLYLIALRMMRPWAAFTAALFYSTQPVFFGHGFINPKDAIFMDAFIAAVATGIIMVDALRTDGKVLALARGDWTGASARARSGLMALGIGCVVLALVWVISAKVLVPGGVSVLYHSDPSSFAGKLFARFAGRGEVVPVDAYVAKAVTLFNRGFAALTILFLLVLLLLSMRVFPGAARQWWRQNKRALLAGVFLGLCISVRILGPAAGGVILLYYLLRAEWRSWPVLVTYLAAAAVAMYATWPYLWAHPLRRLFESLSLMSAFPWKGRVLFNGQQYFADALPHTYLPTLLSVQITIPVLILFLLGVGLLVIRIWKKDAEWPRLVIVAGWFFIPFTLAVILQPNMYDNFRHFLFILPPIFLIAGLGVDFLYEQIKPKAVWAVIALLVVLPGMLTIAQLHPYEYVYYNRLVGGTEGAYQRFEMDYWLTSYRAAAEYLNENAPPDSKVVVWNYDRMLETYIRPDIQLASHHVVDEQGCGYDYAVVSSRSFKDIYLYPDAPVIYTIGDGAAAFTVIKQLPPCSTGETE